MTDHQPTGLGEKRARSRALRTAAVRRSGRGAVLIEFLVVFMPLVFLFVGVWQVCELYAAQLVVARASTAAGRAAGVVLPDNPAFYDEAPVGSFSGARAEDIKRAAGMILAASPHFDREFEVTVEGIPQAEFGTIDVTVRASLQCAGLRMVCPFAESLALRATSRHAYHGAAYEMEPSESAYGGLDTASIDPCGLGRGGTGPGGASNSGETRSGGAGNFGGMSSGGGGSSAGSSGGADTGGSAAGGNVGGGRTTCDSTPPPEIPSSFATAVLARGEGGPGSESGGACPLNRPLDCSKAADQGAISCVRACQACTGANDGARYNQLKDELDSVTRNLNDERKNPPSQRNDQAIDEAEARLQRVLDEFNGCATCSGRPRNSDACLNKPKPDVKGLIREVQNRRQQYCATGNSVFWSGGKAGAEAAQAWARAHSGQTLEQTRGGDALEQRDLFSRNSCSGFTRKEAAAVWNAASIAFAECVKGSALKFQDCRIAKSSDSLGTWERLEKPILESRGISIIGYDFAGHEEPLCD